MSPNLYVNLVFVGALSSDRISPVTAAAPCVTLPRWLDIFFLLTRYNCVSSQPSLAQICRPVTLDTLSINTDRLLELEMNPLLVESAY